MNNGPPLTREELVRAVIKDIDDMMTCAQTDLRQLNTIGKFLRKNKEAGNITDLHYTVDQERLQRTNSKCKYLILTLTEQKHRAVGLLKEL